MDKSIRIVLITLAIYVVLAIQYLFEKNIFFIPYIFNPLALFFTSIILTINDPKKINNVLYLIGISFYCFLSERTLNLAYNYSNNDFFYEVITNPFTRLACILSFFTPLILITIRNIKNNKLHFISLFLLIITLIAGLSQIKYEMIYIIGFTSYVIIFTIIDFTTITLSDKLPNKGIIPQLFLFLILETAFFIIAKSW